MKTATVADLRNDFSRVARWIADGEAVRITKRGRHFATLAPAEKKKAIVPWPDMDARLVRPAGGVSSEVIDYLRGER